MDWKQFAERGAATPFDIRLAANAKQHAALLSRITATTSQFPRVANSAIVSGLQDLFNEHLEKAEAAVSPDAKQSEILLLLAIMQFLDHAQETRLIEERAEALARKVASELGDKPGPVQDFAKHVLALHTSAALRFKIADSIRNQTPTAEKDPS